MNISVVVPTQNEENSIKKLINDLLIQTVQPKEIIIVDGFSSDSTVNIVKNIMSKNNKVKLVLRKKKCRGSGRNSGIEFAKNKYIALIDAGCSVQKDWLENFLNNKDADIVFGSVVPESINLFDDSYKSILLSKSNKKELIYPSVCSMMVKKRVFDSIKFKESEDGSYIVEDLYFIDQILSSKFKFTYSHNAKVFWKISSKYKNIMSRHKEYSLGALKSKYFKIWYFGLIRNILIFLVISLFSLYTSSLLIILILFLMILKSINYLKFLINYKKYSFFKKIKLILINISQFIIIDIASVISFLKFFIFKRLI